MKNRMRFLPQIITLMVMSSLFVGCGEQNIITPAPPTMPTVSEATPIPSTAVGEPTFAPIHSPEKNYEVISSTIIRKDNIVFEISGVANTGYLQVFVKAAAADLPESYMRGNLVENITFEPTTTPQLDLEPSGGGGGFGLENDQYVVNQEFGYTIKNQLDKGQIIHIGVAVTFNQFTGIANPVIFEFDVLVE